MRKSGWELWICFRSDSKPYVDTERPVVGNDAKIRASSITAVSDAGDGNYVHPIVWDNALLLRLMMLADLRALVLVQRFDDQFPGGGPCLA